MPTHPRASTPELNGENASTPLEINLNADHAGPSDQLKLFQTDSVLPQRELLTLSSLHKTWYLATEPTTDAKVDISATPGLILPRLEPSPKLASHMLPKAEPHQAALRPARMDQPKRNTSARLTQLLTQPPLLESKLRSTPVDQLKEDSASTKISTTINPEFTSTPLDHSSEVTPSRFLDGALKRMLTTGSSPTPGEPAGENQVSSELNKEIAVSTTKSMPAPQTSPLLFSELDI